MKYQKLLSYWLPRVLLLSFALSLILPAPEFVSGLAAGEYTIWLARFIWVISVPVVFCSILMIIVMLKKK